jgi:hypothetical protein
MQLVAPLDQHFSGMVDLLALSPLHGLTCFELLSCCCSLHAAGGTVGAALQWRS